jgi:hypothetical protein
MNRPRIGWWFAGIGLMAGAAGLLRSVCGVAGDLLSGGAELVDRCGGRR